MFQYVYAQITSYNNSERMAKGRSHQVYLNCHLTIAI